MKKFIFLVFVSMMMVGCDSSEIASSRTDNGYLLEIIDSCEYIKVPIGGYATGVILTHKGNCKFCAEKRKAELKELLKK